MINEKLYQHKDWTKIKLKCLDTIVEIYLCKICVEKGFKVENYKQYFEKQLEISDFHPDWCDIVEECGGVDNFKIAV